MSWVAWTSFKFVLVFMVLEFPFGDTYCTDGYTLIGSRCYSLNEHKSSWEDAAILCAGQNATLATIKDYSTNAVIANMVASTHHAHWIGGHEVDNWKWVNGEQMTYFDWNEGEPNDWNGNIEDRIMLWIGSRHGDRGLLKWNDAGGSAYKVGGEAILKYICQIYDTDCDFVRAHPSPLCNSSATPSCLLVQYENDCYYIANKQNMTWDMAREDCTTNLGYNADIAALSNEDINHMIQNAIMNDTEFYNANYWIGGLEDTNRLFAWNNDYHDLILGYTAWYGTPANEYCVTVSPDSFWRTEACYVHHTSVCEREQTCLPSGCHHGACHTGACVCNTGWTGDNCDKAISPDIITCETGCIHGKCIGTAGGYSCDCREGWSGQHCDTDINECRDSMYCVNGNCTNEMGSYSCNCSDGWMGTRCDQDINECENGQSNCLHGHCFNTDMGYECHCYSGWTGAMCDTDVDECLTDMYMDCIHGRCVNLPGGSTCGCYPGWTGSLCDADINECDVNGTCVHGTCANGDGAYSCSCNHGWTGYRCDEADTRRCPSGFMTLGFKCLHVSTHQESWSGLNEYCQAFDSYLLEIDAIEEQNVIRTYLRSRYSTRYVFWIGALGFATNSWHWSHSHRPLNFTSWRSGYPRSGYECAGMSGSYLYSWINMPCNSNVYGICETEMKAIHPDHVIG